MFTGIVEEIGTIKSVRRGGKSAALTIGGHVIFNDLKLGDSVAVNGVCLTVTSFSACSFTADVMNETINRSTLGLLKSGSHVNLERAMLLNGRFGGHLVSGHIDGTGKITDIRKDENAVWYTVCADGMLMRYMIEKGSIAIDGISLTIAKVSRQGFSVSIIPHTAGTTTLAEKKVGDAVNLENDMVGKYIEKLIQPQQPNTTSNITPQILEKYGF